MKRTGFLEIRDQTPTFLIMIRNVLTLDTSASPAKVGGKEEPVFVNRASSFCRCSCSNLNFARSGTMKGYCSFALAAPIDPS